MSKYLTELLADAQGWATCEGCDSREEFFAETGVSDEDLVAAIHKYWPNEDTLRVFRLPEHSTAAQPFRRYLHDLRTTRAKVDPIASLIADWMEEVIDVQYVNDETRASWLDYPTFDVASKARAWKRLAKQLVAG